MIRHVFDGRTRPSARGARLGRGLDHGSLAALYALKRGEVHVAGIHMMDHRSGDYNSPFLKRYLKGKSDGDSFCRVAGRLVVKTGQSQKNPER